MKPLSLSYDNVQLICLVALNREVLKEAASQLHRLKPKLQWVS